MMPFNAWLVAGGLLRVIAALLHLATIAGGPAWCRFFPAGGRMAEMAARGDSRAWFITLGIAAVLAAWSACAFSGAGVIPRLPLLGPGLVGISAVYRLRGAAPLPLMLLRPAAVDGFMLWGSLIVLGYGLIYAIGTWTAWPEL